MQLQQLQASIESNINSNLENNPSSLEPNPVTATIIQQHHLLSSSTSKLQLIQPSSIPNLHTQQESQQQYNCQFWQFITFIPNTLTRLILLLKYTCKIQLHKPPIPRPHHPH